MIAKILHELYFCLSTSTSSTGSTTGTTSLVLTGLGLFTLQDWIVSLFALM
jgi:hypothetical protein